MHTILVNSLKIKKYNVNDLRAKAHDLMDKLRRPSGQLGQFGSFLSWNSREELYRVEEIEDAFKQLLLELYPNTIVSVIVTDVDLAPLSRLGETPVDGFAALARKGRNLFYFVVLDKKSLDGVKQNDFAYWRVLKSIYLHEISHTLLNHPGLTFFQGQLQVQQGVQDHNEQDDDCDILSYVLAFWPFERFRSLVDDIFEQWGTKSIRINIANVYKMPVNAVVQWMVIMLSDPSQYKYWLHYAWLSVNDNLNHCEEPGEILDCYDCWDVLKSLDQTEEGRSKKLSSSGLIVDNIEEYAAGRLFMKNTSAREALQKREDSAGKVHNTCKCVAFYDEKKHLYNREHDEVVVIGLAERSGFTDDRRGSRCQLSSIHHS